jgi:multidrug efflux pump subunit AcrA (membrane-fusion protein)
MTNNRLPAFAAVALALHSFACSSSKPQSATSVGAANAPVAAKSATVTVVKATVKPVAASVESTGSFVARDVSDVGPQVAGRVSETPVDVGDFVKQGQIIARLENRDAELRLEQAKAAEAQAEAAVRQAQSRIGLDGNSQFNPGNVPEVLSAKSALDSANAQAKLAEADAKRYEALVATGDVSKSAYEKIRTQADTAIAQANSVRQQYEATLNGARQNYQGVMNAQAALNGFHTQTAMASKAVEDTLIRAPFSGYISARPIAVGQYVALTNKIATVMRIQPIRLELQVQESNAARIKEGAAVESGVPSFPERVFKGTVTAINPAIDPNSRSFTVVAEFPNSDNALKPGMFAKSRILLPGSTSGVFIPRGAVITDATTNSSQVFFVRDGKARVAVVQLGMLDGDLIQILNGIAPDATIIVDNLKDLYDGETLNVPHALTMAAQPGGVSN